jgi:hypothetical protein
MPEQQSSSTMSQNQKVKAAGFTSFVSTRNPNIAGFAADAKVLLQNQFMLSYGLKISDPDDVEEAKKILNALFEKK